MSDRFNNSFEQVEDTQEGRYLTFGVGNEVYALEIRYVVEIVGVQPITEVPEYPEHLKGIINLRGKIIPVMDMRLRFRKPPREYDSRTCIIVINTDVTQIGLIVDSVAEVIDIPKSNIVPPPDTNKGGRRYISAIGKVGEDIKLIVDCYKLLDDDDTALFETLN